ncbi:response regulator [Methanocalculus chunghsingensis]|uniref:response regulator n=1 Tax=Methanocalculus chunghsingensis TaxID=156457 RepID=UPI001B8CEFD7|nr:response regulator [Methanocalculus chunghsingensis]
MNEPAILIVEDEAVTAMVLKTSLTEMGYSVCGISATGERAVEMAGELRPDLILMDIMLAGKMNGIEAAEQIKEKYRIPLIFLTAFSDDRYIHEAKLTEPFGYILKPVRELELRTTIEMAFYKHAMEKVVREQAEIIRVLLNETRDLHYLMDRDGTILTANDALAKRVGITADELIGTSIHDLVASGHLSPTMAASKLPSLVNCCSLRFEEEFGDCWFDIGIHPVSGPDGAISQYAVHIHDTSRVKAMEGKMRTLSELLMKTLYPQKGEDDVSLDDLQGAEELDLVIREMKESDPFR